MTHLRHFRSPAFAFSPIIIVFVMVTILLVLEVGSSAAQPSTFVDAPSVTPSSGRPVSGVIVATGQSAAFIKRYLVPTVSDANSQIDHTNNQVVHIVSDSTIKYSEALATGWETLVFDDSMWQNVVAPSGGLCDPSAVSRIPNSTALPAWSQNPQQHQTIYARKVFTVQNPITATIQTLVDDDFDLYVNGVLVRSDWNGRWSYYEDDVSGLIRGGTNVVALKASDSLGGCQSLAFDVTIGQGTLYSIIGRVTDGSSNPISGVTVSTDRPPSRAFDRSINKTDSSVATNALRRSASVLFLDDFNDGNADGWTTSGLGTWAVDNGEYVVDMGPGQQRLGLSVAGDTSWTDYTYEADLESIGSVDKHLIVRYIDDNNYYSVGIISSPHNLADISKKENGVVTNLRIVTYPNSAETWYHTKVVVQGNRIEVYINGAPILDYTDTSTSLTHGKIGLAGWTGAWGSDTVRFDNVVVTSDGGTYDIAGQVRRINSTSISGVAILASPNISATTDVSGYYTITGLITGTYTITPTKAGYIFSPPSRTVSVPPDATGQDFVGSSDKNWTVMIYLDGDNNLDPNYVSVFNQLESVANNNAANVIVAWDRLGTNNSMYYKVIYDTDLNALANYTEGVNRWTKGELNMGNPNTLSGFVQWARTSFPAQHDALFISNHGTGLNGTARDQTSGNDWITIQELGNALAAATGNGSSKLDVVFADSCLMAMMEDAYQIRNYADYYVASENLLWITNDPSSGPYDNYISLISSFTSAQDFATSLVAQYKSWLDSAWPSLPYTLSAVDLSQINSVVTAIKDLAVTLKAQMSSYGAQVAAARAETQRFDSTNNFRIEANDQYMDLFDFAMHIATHITDTMVLSQANAITTSLDGYIIAETHHSGTYRGPETNWQDVTWNLDGAHGVSIFFPPNRSSFYDVSRYDFAEGGSWPARYQGPTNQVEDGEVRWTPMLIDYFQVVQPGGPDTPNPPDLAAPSSPPLRVYLPLIVLDH